MKRLHGGGRDNGLGGTAGDHYRCAVTACLSVCLPGEQEAALSGLEGGITSALRLRDIIPAGTYLAE